MTQPLPIQIVLSKEAVNLLFPEGSEARVQLASAAVKSLITQAIKPHALSEDIRLLIGTQIDQAKADVLKELGISPGWSHNSLVFSDSFKDGLRAHAKSIAEEIASATLKEEVRKAVDEGIERATGRAESTMHLVIQQKVIEAVRGAVGRAIEGALTLQPAAKPAG